MSTSRFPKHSALNRRAFLRLGTAGLSALVFSPLSPWGRTAGYGDGSEGLGLPQPLPPPPHPLPPGGRGEKSPPPPFLPSCMAQPYHDFPRQRALTGITAAA